LRELCLPRGIVQSCLPVRVVVLRHHQSQSTIKLLKAS